jgi:hypothetical protein
MTNEEMDKAIAEFMGYDHVEEGHVYSLDLQAMWQAEQRLFTRRHDARDIFIDRLCRIMDPVNGYRKQSAADIIDSTAEQHARAFVETIKNIKP